MPNLCRCGAPTIDDPLNGITFDHYRFIPGLSIHFRFVALLQFLSFKIWPRFNVQWMESVWWGMTGCMWKIARLLLSVTRLRFAHKLACNALFRIRLIIYTFTYSRSSPTLPPHSGMFASPSQLLCSAAPHMQLEFSTHPFITNLHIHNFEGVFVVAFCIKSVGNISVNQFSPPFRDLLIFWTLSSIIHFKETSIPENLDLGTGKNQKHNRTKEIKPNCHKALFFSNKSRAMSEYSPLGRFQSISMPWKDFKEKISLFNFPGWDIFSFADPIFQETFVTNR